LLTLVKIFILDLLGLDVDLFCSTRKSTTIFRSISLPKERLRLSDMYFSIWTNQYPYQLSNPLTPLDQQEGWSNGVDQWAIVYGNIVNI
jgi:hypothetical protein